MKTTLSAFAAFFVFTSALLAQPAANYTVQVTATFDYPGAGNLTRPQKINDRGDVSGFFIDSSGATHGFYRTADGTFSPALTDPHDTSETTLAEGINNQRLLCGYFREAASGRYHGFFYSPRGYTNYNIPDSYWTFILGLNNQGDFCGSTIVNRTVQNAYTNIGGNITLFAVPDAAATYAFAINDVHQVCGYFLEADAVAHGFYVDADGTMHQPVDPDDSTETSLFGNNNRNIIVGRYADSSGIFHGLVFFPPDSFVVFDYPGTSYTSLNGINDKNEIVGRFTDSVGIDHGFTAQLVKNVPREKELPLGSRAHELPPGN